jgi:hypothetical protein
MQNSQNFHSYPLILIPNLNNLDCKRYTSIQIKAIFYFHFDIFIFKNKVNGGKCNQTDNLPLFPATVECPEWVPILIFYKLFGQKYWTLMRFRMWTRFRINLCFKFAHLLTRVSRKEEFWIAVFIDSLSCLYLL